MHIYTYLVFCFFTEIAVKALPRASREGHQTDHFRKFLQFVFCLTSTCLPIPPPISLGPPTAGDAPAPHNAGVPLADVHVLLPVCGAPPCRGPSRRGGSALARCVFAFGTPPYGIKTALVTGVLSSSLSFVHTGRDDPGCCIVVGSRTRDVLG